MLATNAATLYVDPGDRERVQQLMEAGGRVQDFALEMRTGDGGTVWVRINSRSVRESDTDYYEGILEDIRQQRRAEDAEALRAVAKLANAASHQQARFDQALVAAKRIDVSAHMGRSLGSRLSLHRGLTDARLRRSGTAPPASLQSRSATACTYGNPENDATIVRFRQRATCVQSWLHPDHHAGPANVSPAR